MTDIQERLFALRDEHYRDFQARLIPTLPPERIIGVRTPALREMTKEMSKGGEAEAFLRALPHLYFEENQLHAFIISEMKSYPDCLEALGRFLPFVDNWATCDQMSPKLFRKHRPELLKSIRKWLASGECYTIRFGLGMLMTHFLEEEFDEVYLRMAAAVRSREYYVNMMIAWYFATALAKQYEAALPYLTEGGLDPWVRRKTIQKAMESRRIPAERKRFLLEIR